MPDESLFHCLLSFILQHGFNEAVILLNLLLSILLLFTVEPERIQQRFQRRLAAFDNRVALLGVIGVADRDHQAAVSHRHNIGALDDAVSQRRVAHAQRGQVVLANRRIFNDRLVQFLRQGLRDGIGVFSLPALNVQRNTLQRVHTGKTFLIVAK